MDALPAALHARVLTHASWAASPGDSYERYELLGDAVLDLALGAHLLERFPVLGGIGRRIDHYKPIFLSWRRLPLLHF